MHESLHRECWYQLCFLSDTKKFLQNLYLSCFCRIPNLVSTIGSNVFYILYKVKYLAFGRSVVEEAIKNMYRCYGPLVLPGSVEIIGVSAFANCSSFNYLRHGINIKYIWNYTFNDCFGFKSILRITASLETLGNYSFNKCTQMVDKIVISNNVYFIGE